MTIEDEYAEAKADYHAKGEKLKRLTGDDKEAFRPVYESAKKLYKKLGKKLAASR